MANKLVERRRTTAAAVGLVPRTSKADSARCLERLGGSISRDHCAHVYTDAREAVYCNSLDVANLHIVFHPSNLQRPPGCKSVFIKPGTAVKGGDAHECAVCHEGMTVPDYRFRAAFNTIAVQRAQRAQAAAAVGEDHGEDMPQGVPMPHPQDDFDGYMDHLRAAEASADCDDTDEGSGAYEAVPNPGLHACDFVVKCLGRAWRRRDRAATAPARKAPACNAPARKAPARKAPARKAPARKAPAHTRQHTRASTHAPSKQKKRASGPAGMQSPARSL